MGYEALVARFLVAIQQDRARKQPFFFISYGAELIEANQVLCFGNWLLTVVIGPHLPVTLQGPSSSHLFALFMLCLNINTMSKQIIRYYWWLTPHLFLSKMRWCSWVLDVLSLRLQHDFSALWVLLIVFYYCELSFPCFWYDYHTLYYYQRHCRSEEVYKRQ